MRITPRKAAWWLPFICLFGAVACGAVSVIAYMQYGKIPIVDRGLEAMMGCVVVAFFFAMMMAITE